MIRISNCYSQRSEYNGLKLRLSSGMPELYRLFVGFIVEEMVRPRIISDLKRRKMGMAG
jgi:hypothetical protein